MGYREFVKYASVLCASGACAFSSVLGVLRFFLLIYRAGTLPRLNSELYVLTCKYRLRNCEVLAL